MAKDSKKKGISWRPINISSLNKDLQALYKEYADVLDNAKKLAGELKAGLQEEWHKKYPNGVEGKVAAFNITGGKVQGAMTAMKKDGPKRPKGGHEGADVFSHP